MIRPALLAIVLCVGNACAGKDEAPAPLVRKRPAPEPPDPALVDDLDRGVQARFRNVRDEDLHKKNLGTSRYAALGLRRRGTVREDLKDERRTLEGITKAGWQTAVYVVEARPDGMINGPITLSRESWGLFADEDGVRELAARAMATRAAVRGEGSGLALEARPVPASEASCLQCHRRKKLGEPLGALVYAFRPEPLAPLLGIR